MKHLRRSVAVHTYRQTLLSTSKSNNTCPHLMASLVVAVTFSLLCVFSGLSDRFYNLMPLATNERTNERSIDRSIVFFFFLNQSWPGRHAQPVVLLPRRRRLRLPPPEGQISRRPRRETTSSAGVARNRPPATCPSASSRRPVGVGYLRNLPPR